MFAATETMGRKRKDTSEISRAGKKSLTVWVPEDMVFAFKILAAERKRQMQDVLLEILNDGLAKYGKPKIED